VDPQTLEPRHPCTACKGSGQEEITVCPMTLITAGAGDVVRAADLAKRGILPIAGGWLDQTDSIVTAMERFWNESGDG
jgi:hypothetical protein